MRIQDAPDFYRPLQLRSDPEEQKRNLLVPEVENKILRIVVHKYRRI